MYQAPFGVGQTSALVLRRTRLTRMFGFETGTSRPQLQEVVEEEVPVPVEEPAGGSDSQDDSFEKTFERVNAPVGLVSD